MDNGIAIMTLQEVADVTRVPLNTLRYWRSQGKGQGPRTFRLGGRVMAYSSDVIAWLDEQRAQGEGQAS
jgi:DNA-binding transcriptional MerR regulator